MQKGGGAEKKEPKPNCAQRHVHIHMEHNDERLERTDESDARKWATPHRVGKAIEPHERTGHETQQGANEPRGQPQLHKTRGHPPQREKKRKSQTARPKKKTRETAPSAKGTRSVDGGRGRRPPDPRKKEKGVGVEATPTECAAEGAREARPRPSLLRGTRSRTHLEPAREGRHAGATPGNEAPHR